MPSRGRPRRTEAVLHVAGLALLVIAVGSCSSAAKRRWLEALFDAPPSTREGTTAEEQRSQAVARPKAAAPARPSRRRLFPEKGSIHGPYAADLCQACHLGRGEDTSSRPGLSLARLRAPTTELCTGCHRLRDLRDVATDPRARLHGPVAAGRCTACHAAHAARERRLLLRPPGALCLQCHGAARGEDHPEAEPAECLDCHDPHLVGGFGS